jgi:hypothetical protein
MTGGESEQLSHQTLTSRSGLAFMRPDGFGVEFFVPRSSHSQEIDDLLEMGRGTHLLSFLLLERIVGEILIQSGIMKTDAQQDTWAAAYNAALTDLLAGTAHGEFDPISSSENTLQVFARPAKAFADLAEKDLKDYQTS